MQFQADMLDRRIIRSRAIESTARGVAFLAGVTAGLWNGKDDLKKFNRTDRVFSPRMSSDKRSELYNGWLKAVERARLK
jgi:glycerol kinase